MSEFGYRSANRKDPHISTGLAVGVVTENYSDEFPGMVRVDIATREKGLGVTDWARVLTTYAGAKRGAYWIPEIGDSVLVGYLGGDLRCPVVLGALWDGGDALVPDTANDKNNIKRITTRAGNEVVFSDEDGKEKITIHTKAELTVELDDEQQSIGIRDKDKKNKLLISKKEGSIQMEAEKKLSIKCGKCSIEMDGQGGSLTVKGDSVSVEATQSLKQKGQTANIEGSQMTIKAQSVLNVQSSGPANIKGAMVKIN